MMKSSSAQVQARVKRKGSYHTKIKKIANPHLPIIIFNFHTILFYIEQLFAAHVFTQNFAWSFW